MTTNSTAISMDADMILGAEDPMAEIAEDLQRSGFHEDNEIAMLGFLGCVARRCGQGLPMVFTGQSSTGKSHIVETLASWIPEDERIRMQYSTPKALLNMAPADGQPLDLSQQVLVADERAEKHVDPSYMRTLYASGAVEVPRAEGATTTIRRLTGRPAMLETTTASRIHDEDENRRLILPVDESSGKLRRIMEFQNQRAAGALEVDPEEIARTQREVQRKLPRFDTVTIQFAEEILPTEAPFGWLLRAHQQLLTITRAVGIVRHRHRGTTDRELWCKLEDYDLAQNLLAPLHGRSLTQLSQQEIEIVESVADGLARRPRRPGKAQEFTRGDLEKWSGLPRRTVERRLPGILASGIFVVTKPGGRGRQHEYLLVSDWQDQLTRGSPFPTADEIRTRM